MSKYDLRIEITDNVWQIFDLNLYSHKFFYFGTVPQFLMLLLTVIVL